MRWRMGRSPRRLDLFEYCVGVVDGTILLSSLSPSRMRDQFSTSTIGRSSMGYCDLWRSRSKRQSVGGSTNTTPEPPPRPTKSRTWKGERRVGKLAILTHHLRQVEADTTRGFVRMNAQSPSVKLFPLSCCLVS